MNEPPKNQSTWEEESVRVGKILSKARLSREESLRDIVNELRISKTYLVALEEGDTKNLPEDTYVKGYIRSYAQHLGLDSEPLLAAFRRKEQSEEGTPEVQVSRDIPVPISPSLWLFFLLLLSAVIVGVGFWSSDSIDGTYSWVLPASPEKSSVESMVDTSVDTSVGISDSGEQEERTPSELQDLPPRLPLAP